MIRISKFGRRNRSGGKREFNRHVAFQASSICVHTLHGDAAVGQRFRESRLRIFSKPSLTAISQFLKQLAALFESSKDQGSIWLTHKRRTQTLNTDPCLVNDEHTTFQSHMTVKTLL